MSLLKELLERSNDPESPFLIGAGQTLSLRQISSLSTPVDEIRPGEVVGLVGDFDALSIATLFALIDRQAVVIPLTAATAAQHDYFLKSGHANAVIQNGQLTRFNYELSAHPLLSGLRDKGHAGLILYTSGTTGLPKAILHDFTKFLKRYAIPRPAWTTLSFLLFDHIGGLNTLFHTMYNSGRVVRPRGRSPQEITADIRTHAIELLPSTPTFFRLWALAGLPPESSLPSLRLFTYGTERMDESTLRMIADSFPSVEIRQTYGMSELGIMRVKTRKRDQLWIEIGGEGISTRISSNGELLIRSENRMEGYLNADTPFDADGWFATKDLVETDGSWLQITGRRDDIINVGGLKVLPAEIESVALEFPGVLLAKATGVPNPVTGSHVELLCQAQEGKVIEKAVFMHYLKTRLPPYAVPLRIKFGQVPLGHRFKRL